MRVALASFLIFALSGEVKACIIPPPQPDQDASKATAIFFGYVTGVRYPDYEKHLLSGKSPSGRPTFDSALTRLLVTHRIIGLAPQFVEAYAPCSAPQKGDPVVVIRRRDGDRLYSGKSALQYLRDLHKALAGER